MTFSFDTTGLEDLLSDIFAFVTKIFEAIKQFFENAFGKDDGNTDPAAE